MALVFREVINSGKNSQYQVVLLHGRGADEEDLLPLAQFFPFVGRVISVRAPYGMGAGYAWYGMTDEGIENVSQLNQSIAWLDALLQEEVPRDALLILLGFSQGGVAAAGLAAYRQAKGIGGLVSLSAPPLPESLVSPVLEHLPVFWGHGVSDPVVPIERGEVALKRLYMMGVVVTEHRYPMVHTIGDQEVRDVRDWTRKIVAGN